MDLFSEAAGADVVALEEVQRTGKTNAKATTIAIAHGLVYDPHVDGRLRLTPLGREKLAGQKF
ncbi:MAG TPA: hypothetical protein VF245_12820 [Solirubrobacterales bacterium]